MAVLESAAFWIILAAVSELIAISPLKDNSIIQLVLSTVKGLSNIPADGKWLLRFSTRSAYDEVNRAIQAKKFYATLPHKLDNAQNDWLKAQPAEESQVTETETGTFGTDGWSISKTHTAFRDD